MDRGRNQGVLPQSIPAADFFAGVGPVYRSGVAFRGGADQSTAAAGVREVPQRFSAGRIPDSGRRGVAEGGASLPGSGERGLGGAGVAAGYQIVCTCDARILPSRLTRAAREESAVAAMMRSGISGTTLRSISSEEHTSELQS